MSNHDENAVRRMTECYSNEAHAYRDHWAPVVHPLACELIEHLPVDGVRRIVDVGAGVGSLLPLLQGRYPDALVVGIDRSEGMLALAEGDANVAVSDACDIGIRDGAFDAAVLAFMLFHLPDPVAGLVAVRRTLRPGGAIALSTWAGDLVSPSVEIWNEELDAHGAVSAESLGRLAQHDLMDTPEKVQSLLTAAGFESITTEQKDFVHELDGEAFIAMRRSVGGNRERFESLSESARTHCLASVRARFAELPLCSVAFRMRVLFATAVAPE